MTEEVDRHRQEAGHYQHGGLWTPEALFEPRPGPFTAPPPPLQLTTTEEMSQTQAAMEMLRAQARGGGRSAAQQEAPAVQPLPEPPAAIPAQVAIPAVGAASTAEEMENAPPVIYEGNNTSCSICLEELQAPQRVCCLLCRHVFHAACWDRQ